MTDQREETLNYCEQLMYKEPQVRHFLICVTSDIPVWSKLYHWFLDKYQGVPHQMSHCFVGTVDIDANRLHLFECDWYQGVVYSVLCSTVYIVPRDIPYMYSICVSDTDEVFIAVDCTDIASGVTLSDMVEQFTLAEKLAVRRMSPLTLLKVYLKRAVSCFVCTSFAQFMLEPSSLNYRYPLTVDQLVTKLLTE